MSVKIDNPRAPLVSIGVPVYNGERWLLTTLPALLNQTYDPLEIIICDNASTDGTERICRMFANQDSRVSYVRNPTNIGVTRNYNKVFGMAKGHYFKWSSASDLCEKNFIEACVRVLESRPDVVLCCPQTRLFVDDPDKGEDCQDDMSLLQERPSDRFRTFRLKLKLNNLLNGVLRSDVLRKTDLIKLFLGSDVNLMAALTMHGKFIQLPDVLFYRRMHPDSSSVLMALSDVNKYYDPAGKDGMLLQNWKVFANCFSNVRRAPIASGEKFRIYTFLLHQLVWSRNNLSRDITGFLNQKFRHKSQAFESDPGRDSWLKR